VTANDSVTVEGSYPALMLGESDTTDLNARVRTSAGAFRIDTVNNSYAAGKTRLLVDHATGDISFYEDTGTTAKFFWDASAERLDLKSGAELVVEETDSSNRAVRIASDVNEGFVQLYKEGVQKIQIRGDGSTYFTGGNVGIGASSPDQLLHISGGSGTTRIMFTRSNAASTGNSFGELNFENSVGTKVANIVAFSGSGNTEAAIKFGVGSNATEAMRIDSSGNMGLGVTPESDIYSSYQTLQFGEAGVISCQSGNNGAVFFGNNFIHNGSNSNTGSKYIESDEASAVKLQTGQVQFLVAPSGTADNAISWTTAMTVQNDGSLLVGTTDGGSSGAGDIVANAIFLGGNQAANELDDYEEGTWTPVFTTYGSTVRATSYTLQEGRYIKIGNLVHYSLDISSNSINTTADSYVSIAGLPFTSGTNGRYPVATYRDCDAFPSNSNNLPSFWVPHSASYLYGQGTNITSNGYVVVSAWNSSGRMNLHGFYYTSDW